MVKQNIQQSPAFSWKKRDGNMCVYCFGLGKRFWKTDVLVLIEQGPV